MINHLENAFGIFLGEQAQRFTGSPSALTVRPSRVCLNFANGIFSTYRLATRSAIQSSTSRSTHPTILPQILIDFGNFPTEINL
jgi:hypothetical protein